MTTDQLGNPVSYSDLAAIKKLERAVELFNCYQSDPLVAVDELLAEHPDFALAHLFKTGLIAMAMDKGFAVEFQHSHTAAEILCPRMNDRERGYLAATRAWAAGEFETAVELWGRVAIDYPRDILAIQLAHLGDFYLGYSQMLRDRIARVLPHWDRSLPGYGYVLGFQAFGLEEFGEYGRAEEVGRAAVALNPKDGWAVHAVAHVYEMKGQAEEGAAWLAQTLDGWAPGSLFAFHNYWHLALFNLDRGSMQDARELYSKVAAGGFGQALELVDGAALLWRLDLSGQNVSEQWAVLAQKWATRIDHCYYAFNDVHAMMSFVGARDEKLQRRQIASLKRAARAHGVNAIMSREIGLPAALGLQAFGQGKYEEAIDRLAPLQAKANRFGGSHAQRDVISWTLTEAAIRSGNRALADAFIAERMSKKPESAIVKGWLAQFARSDLTHAA